MDGESGVDRREGGPERSEVEAAAPLLSGGGGSSVILTPPSATRLIPLRTQDDTRRFLRAIVQKFVEVVDIEMSGLLDALVAVGVIIERDEESLGGTHLPTRSERARRLWSILYHVQHVTFVTQVLPLLCQHYWYIIPQAFWLPGDASVDPAGLQHHQSLEETGNSIRCVRCAIQGRIRPTDLGDLLMTTGLITERTYRNIMNSYRSSNTNWSEIFEAFKKLAGSDVSSHVGRMRRLMANHSLPVPDNLPRLMTQGFPCSCSSRRRPGLCIPDCLADRSSGSESSLPAAPNLSVDGRHPSELSLPSASSHGPENGGWDSHRLSDHYSETSLKEVVSISAQNHPHSAGDLNDEASQSGGSHVSRDRSETSLKEVVGISAQSNSLSTADSDDGTFQGGGGSHTSSDHSDTALKRAVSVTAVSRSWPTVQAAGSTDPQDSLQPASQKTGLEFAEEAEPPPYSRYAEGDGRVSQLADQGDYTETRRIYYDEEVPNDKTKCTPNTYEELSVSATRRKDRAQFHTPTAKEVERSRQTSIPEQRRWTVPPSQGLTICSYSSHPSGSERVNDGFADTAQEVDFFTEENCNFCATTMPWTDPEHMKSDSSFTVSKGSDVVGLLIFCALILAPVVLLFYGVYSQNYAFHVAGTALIILLMCLAVLIRNVHR